MFKNNYRLKLRKSQLIFVLTFITVPIFSQTEAAEGYLTVWFTSAEDSDLKNVEKRDCITQNGIGQTSRWYWVVENTHSSKKIEAGLRVPYTYSFSLNGKREIEERGEEIEMRTISPGQISIICCKRERHESTDNGVYIESTVNSEPYIKWAHLIE